jgi:N-methylhydantoinase A
MQIAFDIGGTFTDFALRDPSSGAVTVWKVPTTPRAPAKAVVASLREKIAAGAVASDRIGEVLHATTIATNAILERKGSRVALITTAGFRDVLLLGRQKRYDTNDLHLDKPRPLVPRADIFEVRERLAPDGAQVTPLDEEQCRALAETIAAGGYQAVAVALLHSYANPAHEQRLATILRAAMPDKTISISSEVSPKFREYERTSTTVANAYVAPLVSQYLAELGESLTQLRITANLSIMQSNGGLVSAGLARSSPIRIVESGPAAGVLMCAEIGREEGFNHVITFDMGGTTAKLGAIDDGVPAVTPTFEVDAVNYKKGSGLPLNITAIELLEIGAGGGSIARSKMGLITVGPDSAGAEPGPICYGRGGTMPTITDANLVLGYLNPDYFNGGAMHLSSGAAEVIERDIGRPLDLTVEEAAWGIHSVANANMERAMRIVSIERGRDPRNYTMVAFGGAGPLHATRLARALEIPRVIVPRGAGVGSALGLLVAKQKVDVAITRVLRLDDGAEGGIASVFAELEERARAQVAQLNSSGAVTIERGASMHHVGQGYEIRVDLPPGNIGRDYEQAAKDAFYAAYKREYGYIDGESAIEVTDWYVQATVEARNDDARLQLELGGATDGDPIVGERLAYFPESGGMVKAKVVNRYALRSEQKIAGPALVEERESTTVVLPGDALSLTQCGNLLIEIGRS